MAPRALPALLLLAVLLSGCTAADDFQRFLNRAQGKTQYQDVQRLNEDLAFAATDTLGPGGAGKQANFNFTTPLGAQKLHVEVSVAFTPQPVALPSQLPQGNVTVALSGPAPGKLMAFSNTAVQTFDLAAPPAGPWAVHVTAFGDGRVHLIALSTEPVP